MNIDLTKIQKKIKEIKADYADIRIEETKSRSFLIRNNEVENISENDNMGYGIRVLLNGKWGFASGTDFSKLNEKIDEASDFARLLEGEKSVFKKVPIVEDYITSPMKEDPTQESLKERIDLFMNYYKFMVSVDNKILKSSQILYTDSKKIKTFLNSEGSKIIQEVKRIGYMFTPTVKEGDNIQYLVGSEASLDNSQIIFGLENKIKEKCDLVLKILKAKIVKAGNFTVVCDQDLAGLLVHEAFGHISEADNVYKDKSMKEIMKIGRTFGKPILNILDDPSYKVANGSYKYDDDGVLTKKNYLIKKGKLVGRLHSRETASYMNEEPTGNARAINQNFMPIVRMSNTFIEKGKDSFEEMISNVKLGIYAKGWIGGQTNHDNFMFSASYGYMIRNGKIAELVRDVRLSGNVFNTLKNIDMIGNDFEISNSLGGCGKENQFPLPVSDGGPHIRIKNVIVGGE